MQTAFIIVLGIYLVATLFYLLRLITGKTILSALGLRVSMLAVIVQFFILLFHLISLPSPLVLTYLEYFQLSAFFLATTFIILCFKKKFYGSGPFVIALVVIFCVYSLTFDSSHLTSTALSTTGYLSFHLISIFLSLSFFSLGLIVAIMFLLSEKQVRSKKIGGIIAKFPSLAVLDETHYRALYAGFVFFTFAILMGAGHSKMLTGHYLANNLTQVGSILSWLFFAMFLNLRVCQGWQGHKGILLSFIGFASMIFLFIVGLK